MRKDQPTHTRESPVLIGALGRTQLPQQPVEALVIPALAHEYAPFASELLNGLPRD